MPGKTLYDHHSSGAERFGKADHGNRPHFDAAPRFATSEADAVLDRLQRNGGALASCECGSRSWLPPAGIYQLVPAGASPSLPARAVVPLTCAICGFTKFYDPVVVASMAESTGRW